jgi:hypothetical protein
MLITAYRRNIGPTLGSARAGGAGQAAEPTRRGGPLRRLFSKSESAVTNEQEEGIKHEVRNQEA